MPLYQYKCLGCGRETEAFMKIDEACADGASWVCGEGNNDVFMDRHADKLEG